MAWDRDKERKAGGIYGMVVSIIALIFVIFWCVAAVSMGAGIMLIFGLPFLGLMVFRLVMTVKAMKKADQKSADPWDQPPIPETPRQNTAGGFCPYCGGTLEEHFQFCPHCGRRLS